MQVCPFDDPTVPFPPPGNYAARRDHQRQRQRRPAPRAGQPKWRYFTANPTLDWSPRPRPTNSVVGCWIRRHAGCTSPDRPVPQRRRRPARGTRSPRPARRRFTTVGNNANTHEAWASPLTPGGTAQAPVSPTREYTDAVHRRLEQLQVRPDPAAPGRQRHQRLGDQPVRRAQPDARLLLLPRLHRGRTTTCSSTTSAATATRPRQRPRDRQRPGRRAHRRPAVVPRPRQRQPDRAAGRHPRHHQPVPLPADRRRVLLPVHRRLAST